MNTDHQLDTARIAKAAIVSGLLSAQLVLGAPTKALADDASPVDDLNPNSVEMLDDQLDEPLDDIDVEEEDSDIVDSLEEEGEWEDDSDEDEWEDDSDEDEWEDDWEDDSDEDEWEDGSDEDEWEDDSDDEDEWEDDSDDEDDWEDDFDDEDWEDYSDEEWDEGWEIMEGYDSLEISCCLYVCSPLTCSKSSVGAIPRDTPLPLASPSDQDYSSYDEAAETFAYASDDESPSEQNPAEAPAPEAHLTTPKRTEYSAEAATETLAVVSKQPVKQASFKMSDRPVTATSTSPNSATRTSLVALLLAAGAAVSGAFSLALRKRRH